MLLRDEASVRGSEGGRGGVWGEWVLTMLIVLTCRWSELQGR